MDRRAFSRRAVGFLTLAAGLLACAPEISVEETLDRESLASGITGTVLKLVGDFSCCDGCCAMDHQTLPLSTDVWVIRGTVPYLDGHSPDVWTLDVELVVRSASDGSFTAKLEPGVYTVFIEVDGELYLSISSYEPNATYYCVEVKDDEFVRLVIEDRSDAIEF